MRNSAEPVLIIYFTKLQTKIDQKKQQMSWPLSV